MKKEMKNNTANDTDRGGLQKNETQKMGGNAEKSAEKVIDRFGHYDQDGASYSDEGVVIASSEPPPNKKPST